MIGLGTIVNVIAIVIGGLLGGVVGKFLTAKIQDTIVKLAGISVALLGIIGVLEEALVVEGGVVSTRGSLVLVLSIVIGGLLGELIGIDRGITQVGEGLKKSFGKEGDNTFTTAFVTATITFSVGAMTIVGPIRDAVWGDYTLLFAKSILDFVMVMIFTASIGKGAIFSAIPVAIIQGVFTLVGVLVGEFLSPIALSYLSMTGSVLVFSIGLNFLFPDKIKTANLIPSMLLAIIFAYGGL